MRVPPRSLAALAVLAALLVFGGLAVSAGGRETASASGAGSWRGLVGAPRAQVPLGQRMIVVLSTPSVAQRLRQAHYATEAQERAWWASAYAAQKQVLLKLAGLGVTVRPDYSYYRVLDGFSAALDPRALSLLEQMPEVAGIYPVRAAFPASVSEQVLSQKEFDAASGHRPDAELPGYDGHGVTIALLDTGVDETHPYLAGRVLPGIDVLGQETDASARANPQDATQREQHGTELAGILVGRGGPAGLHGVAPGATILPIRVAGWQQATDGTYVVYSRSDQLIAGLDRAVDPNGDGDTHDAVRVALVGVAEPYAAFGDGPEAIAVQGALDLNTLVVAPAGNDGGAGPAFGSVAGPAGAPAALAVAATDSRSATPKVRVVLRRGLDVILDQRLPLVGPVAPGRARTLRVAVPRSTRGLAGASSADYFDAHGLSLVAGRAVVVPAGADPADTVVAASRAGAAAVVLYGDALPAGALHLSEDTTAPAVVVPTAAAVELLAAQRAGIDVGIAVGAVHEGANPEQGVATGFSSQGLAYDSGVKPNVAAPGVAVATSEPGRAADGSALYGTVNGTSAAAATVAGAAALLAQMRPDLDGGAVGSLLAGYAQRGRADPVSVGGGVLRLGASASAEVASEPMSLGFGVWQGPRWHATRVVTLRNVSSRRLTLSVAAVPNGATATLRFRVVPERLTIRAGRSRRVKVTLTAPKAPPVRLVTGSIVVSATGTQTLRVPWALLFGETQGKLIGSASISRASFPASDTDPAILTVQAGALVREGGIQIQPVRRLDILLYDASGKFRGVMARMRDLLPGSYSFGITGRGPTSARLPAGAYELRLAAWPTLPLDAKPVRAQVRFRLE
ncbi:MAG TPA: S8 family serine peptidase [Gaiellaceae bacterium]|nr:S8 family serine peptidase [Gaiellaceae bacterium]